MSGFFKTHDGDIMTDNSDYVWLSCSRYNLPDTTNGNIGYHVVYRPLCGSAYKGNELITEAMCKDIRDHYEEIDIKEQSDRKVKFEAMIGKPERIGQMDKMICHKCGTVCYGDCES
jgi:hypothetical protein